jgi:hypothetical protein
MNFIPKQHLEIGNYIKYIDEILHKCDKGIEYCKICPNEFVCSELEKDDFGLNGSTITDVLTAIQYALSKVPGYINPDKRNELRDRIKSYINESPIHERGIWENSILDILLDDKLANPSYKPKSKIGEVRTLLTYNDRISFSVLLKSLPLENNKDILQHTMTTLPSEITSKGIRVINQFIQSRHISNKIQPIPTQIQHCLENSKIEVIQRCNLNDAGLATALCYYSALIQSPIPENIVITGRLDDKGGIQQVDFLDDKIETVLRELHFVDIIIIPTGSSWITPVPEHVKIIKFRNLEETIDFIFKINYVFI